MISNRFASAKTLAVGKVANFVDVFVVMLVCSARQLVYVAVLKSLAETIRNLCLLPILQAILQQISVLAVHSKGTRESIQVKLVCHYFGALQPVLSKL